MMKRATTAWHGQSTKQARKQILRTYPTWDFARRSGDSWVQTIGVTQGPHGQSTEIGKKQLLYEIGVTQGAHGHSPLPALPSPLPWKQAWPPKVVRRTSVWGRMCQDSIVAWGPPKSRLECPVTSLFLAKECHLDGYFMVHPFPKGGVTFSKSVCSV